MVKERMFSIPCVPMSRKIVKLKKKSHTDRIGHAEDTQTPGEWKSIELTQLGADVYL